MMTMTTMMNSMPLQLQHAVKHALISSGALLISHTICVAIVMYMDLTNKWAKYSINPNRNVSIDDYTIGLKSFVFDITCLFFPFMTFCFYVRDQEIRESSDSATWSLTKLACGYVLGKLWAFGVHYVLHFPSLYHLHRRHHCNPRAIVASAAWMDSKTEYAVMELPSFAMTVLLFPTHFHVHALHFVLHGWDGAAGHSGFKAPGILGALFDGEYHYYHHAHLTMNYAELEFLDILCGTHHTQHKHHQKYIFTPPTDNNEKKIKSER